MRNDDFYYSTQKEVKEKTFIKLDSKQAEYLTLILKDIKQIKMDIVEEILTNKEIKEKINNLDFMIHDFVEIKSFIKKQNILFDAMTEKNKVIYTNMLLKNCDYVFDKIKEQINKLTEWRL